MKRLQRLGLLNALVLAVALPAAAQGNVWATRVLPGSSTPHVTLDADRAADGTLWVAARDVPQSPGPELCRFDVDGRLLFQFAAPDVEDQSYACLAAGLAGEVFLVGKAEAPGQLPIGPSLGGEDAFVAKFNADGTLAWAIRLGASGDDSARVCATDATGAVLIGGQTSVDASFGGAPIGTFDAYVARIERNGTIGFVTRLGSTFAQRFTLLGLSAQPDGCVLCFGEDYDGSGLNGAARAVGIDPAGDVEWTFDLNNGWFGDISPATSGGCFLLGGTGGGPLSVVQDIFRIDAQGQLAWSRPASQSSPSTSAQRVHGLTGGGALLTRFPDELVRISDAGTELEVVAYDVETVFGGGVVLREDGDGGALMAGAVISPTTSAPVATLTRVALSTGGNAECSGTANSTGEAARLLLAGEPTLSGPQLTAHVQALPPGEFAMFVASTTPDFVPFAGGAAGPLCLGGSIRRFNRPGEIQQVSPFGFAHLRVDPQDFPGVAGSITVLTGETWHFQLWYRDAGGSNFSSSRSVTFQ